MRLLKYKKEWFPLMIQFEEGGKKLVSLKKLGEENIFKDYNFDFGETYTLNYKFENSDHVHTTLEVSGDELFRRSMKCLNHFFIDEEDLNTIRNCCCEFFGLKSIREISKSKFKKVKKDYEPRIVRYVEKSLIRNSYKEFVKDMICCYFFIKLLVREEEEQETNTLTVIDCPSDKNRWKKLGDEEQETWKDQPITKRLNLSFKEYKKMSSMGYLRYSWKVS